MTIRKAIEMQGIQAAWRGEEPMSGSQITEAYCAELVNNLPRLIYAEGEEQVLDLAQLATDFDSLAVTESEQDIREAKEAEVKALALSRIKDRVPALETLEMVGLIVEMVTAGMAQTPSEGTDMAAARAIFLYARARVVNCRTAPLEQVAAYDPATDSGFPL